MKTTFVLNVSPALVSLFCFGFNSLFLQLQSKQIQLLDDSYLSLARGECSSSPAKSFRSNLFSWFEIVWIKLYNVIVLYFRLKNRVILWLWVFTCQNYSKIYNSLFLQKEFFSIQKSFQPSVLCWCIHCKFPFSIKLPRNPEKYIFRDFTQKMYIERGG